MVEVTNELIDQVLQRMQGGIGELKTGMREVRHRLGALEMQLAGLPNRVDRLDDNVERVMRRLELSDGAEAPTP